MAQTTADTVCPWCKSGSNFEVVERRIPITSGGQALVGFVRCNSCRFVVGTIPMSGAEHAARTG